MTEPLDCLIIGGGPAGLTAAIYLGRFRRRVLLVDKGWSRAKWITHSHNLPGFPKGLAGPTLLENLQAQAKLYGAELTSGEIETLSRNDTGPFTATSQGSTFTAQTVILATGVVENNPPVTHVADAVKKGLIRTCPICDGFESIGKSVAVLGNGEHAAGEALYLRTYTKNLQLLLMASDSVSLSKLTRATLQTADIEVTHVAIGSVNLGDDGVTVLSLEDGQIHRFDLIYSAFGTTSQTKLSASLGAHMDEAGRLIVNEHQATSVDGLFAAGDVVRGLNQISVAEGEAAIAATAVHNRLPRVYA